MAKRAKKLRPPPLCAHCAQPAHLVTGREVYPHRPAFYDRNLWKCTPCSAWVGCHKGGSGTRPLGAPANLELRHARSKLHDGMFDPLWKNAVDSGAYAPEDHKAGFIIRAAARSRVYAFLAHHMGLDTKTCHIGMFTLEQCRDAWRVLRGRTYPEIREWSRRDRVAKLLGTAPSVEELKHACYDHCEGCRTNWRLKDGRHPEPSAMACQAIELRDALTEKLENEAAARSGVGGDLEQGVG